MILCSIWAAVSVPPVVAEPLNMSPTPIPAIIPPKIKKYVCQRNRYGKPKIFFGIIKYYDSKTRYSAGYKLVWYIENIYPGSQQKYAGYYINTVFDIDFHFITS